MEKTAKIFVAGHKGLVGSALIRKLISHNYTHLLTCERKQLDLLDQQATDRFFHVNQPDYVFCAAAKVGGILANKSEKADFIYQNLAVQTNIIHSAYKYRVKKLLFLGSSCIYPRECPQPIKEEYLLTGPLEPTNDAYAIAKIAGIKMCQSYNQQYHTHFISVMPTNLYGENDNFNLDSAHVIPAIIRKLYEAKERKQTEVKLWGSGNVKREFLNVNDLADACLYLMNHYDRSEIVNIGSGQDLSIREVAQLLKKIIGYKGKIIWNRDMPDGSPRKLLDVSYLHSLGWSHQIELEDGLRSTCKWFIDNYHQIRT